MTSQMESLRAVWNRSDIPRHSPQETLGADALVGMFPWFERILKRTQLPVSFPETVVYEHSFPKGWYWLEPTSKARLSTKRLLEILDCPLPFTGDEQRTVAGEVLRTVKSRECESTAIIESFKRVERANSSGILAQLVRRSSDGHGIQVKYLTLQSLTQLLLNLPEQGILSRFIPPKGIHNEVVVATWTPNRILVARRRNIHCLNDTDLDVAERADVMEAARSEPIFSSDILKALVGKMVTRLVAEIERVVEKRRVVEFEAHFKVDPQSKIWLLWVSKLSLIRQPAIASALAGKMVPSDPTVVSALGLHYLENYHVDKRHRRGGGNRSVAGTSQKSPLSPTTPQTTCLERSVSGSPAEHPSAGPRGVPNPGGSPSSEWTVRSRGGAASRSPQQRGGVNGIGFHHRLSVSGAMSGRGGLGEGYGGGASAGEKGGWPSFCTPGQTEEDFIAAKEMALEVAVRQTELANPMRRLRDAYAGHVAKRRLTQGQEREIDVVVNHASFRNALRASRRDATPPDDITATPPNTPSPSSPTGSPANPPQDGDSLDVSPAGEPPGAAPTHVSPLRGSFRTSRGSGQLREVEGGGSGVVGSVEHEGGGGGGGGSADHTVVDVRPEGEKMRRAVERRMPEFFSGSGDIGGGGSPGVAEEGRPEEEDGDDEDEEGACGTAEVGSSSASVLSGVPGLLGLAKRDGEAKRGGRGVPRRSLKKRRSCGETIFKIFAEQSYKLPEKYTPSGARRIGRSKSYMREREEFRKTQKEMSGLQLQPRLTPLGPTTTSTAAPSPAASAPTNTSVAIPEESVRLAPHGAAALHSSLRSHATPRRYNAAAASVALPPDNTLASSLHSSVRSPLSPAKPGASPGAGWHTLLSSHCQQMSPCPSPSHPEVGGGGGASPAPGAAGVQGAREEERVRLTQKLDAEKRAAYDALREQTQRVCDAFVEIEYLAYSLVLSRASPASFVFPLPKGCPALSGTDAFDMERAPVASASRGEFNLVLRGVPTTLSVQHVMRTVKERAFSSLRKAELAMLLRDMDAGTLRSLRHHRLPGKRKRVVRGANLNSVKRAVESSRLFALKQTMINYVVPEKGMPVHTSAEAAAERDDQGTANEVPSSDSSDGMHDSPRWVEWSCDLVA